MYSCTAEEYVFWCEEVACPGQSRARARRETSREGVVLSIEVHMSFAPVFHLWLRRIASGVCLHLSHATSSNLAMAGDAHRVVPGYFELLRRVRDTSSAETSDQVASGSASAQGTSPEEPGDRGERPQLPTAASVGGLPCLTSLRKSCPACGEELALVKHHSKFAEQGVYAIVVAEPETYRVNHCAKTCRNCSSCSTAKVKYWHGYYETSGGGKTDSWCKVLDVSCLPGSVWMLSKSFGIHSTWARKWCYRLYAHRSSFVGEGHILQALQPNALPAELDAMLLDGWVRWQVWRRACEAGVDVKITVAKDVLELELEALLSSTSSWYGPLMHGRRLQFWRRSGDRLDILCFDGNAKLYRRTCGAPCAETKFIACLGLHLIRGCPESPQQTGVLCNAHAALRCQGELTEVVEKHKMLQPLDSQPFNALHVQLSGFAKRWQPASTIDPRALQAYFAKHGAEVIEARKQKRAEHREQHRKPYKQRFLGDWSSESVKAACTCKTHKESLAAVRTASRSAGFLMAVSESGLIAGLAEIITAETLSQRYSFLASMAEAEPALRVMVHDDACHVRVFARTHTRDDCELSKRLSHEDFHYIVDRPHSRGHVDATCIEECFPDVAKNQAILADFPTPICESVNAELSPLAHTIHHMQRWLCLFVVTECVDVHNQLREQRKHEARERQERKRARVSRTASRSAPMPQFGRLT
jgi:hypothetical protein